MFRLLCLRRLLFVFTTLAIGFTNSFSFEPIIQRRTVQLSMASTTTSVGPEIEIISQPDSTFLEKKGIDNWGTWGCGVSKFPWTYSENESCYLLSGKVTVTPTDGRQVATFGKGDFVTFPAGMSCTWDVSEPVRKHYMFF
jgi:uncharacterized protein